MKDFKSFNPEDNDNVSGKGLNADNMPKEALDMVSGIAKQFQGKSEGEMMAAILKEAEKNRKKGILTDGEIDKFYSLVSPMIDEGKRKKLKSIVDKLKKK